MPQTISIAIETSCAAGGVALGVGDELRSVVNFDASARHATQLVGRLKELLACSHLRPADLNEVYVCAGPGSFTGVRVGITVARTLGQMLAGLRCVAVPTPQAVAENARDLPWQRLAVVLDAREDVLYVRLFERPDGRIVPCGQPQAVRVEDFLRSAPRPITLTGEGLLHHSLTGEGIAQAPRELLLPTAEGVWRVGRRLAEAGQFTPFRQLVPIYARKPEAVRLWDARHSPPES